MFYSKPGTFFFINRILSWSPTVHPDGFLVKFAKDFSIKDHSSSDLWHAHVVSPRFYPHDIPLLRYGFDNLPQFRELIFYYLIRFYKDEIKALLHHHSDRICQLLYDGLNHKDSAIRTADFKSMLAKKNRPRQVLQMYSLR